MEIKNIPHVRNMRSNSGNAVPNQFIINTDDGVIFQSYSTVIAFKPFGSDTVYLDENKWDYSTTTSKYRNQFLNQTTRETQQDIDAGNYKLVDLNK